MPQAADRWCPRCRSPHPAGSECPVGRAERLARVDAARPGPRQRGYTTEWEHGRKLFLARHPLCRVCQAPATVVDHIVRHAGDQKLFWNRNNWQPLCQLHHDQKTMRENNERRRA
jgi:5-methylcytosine-specific restriction enzyme A